MQRFAGIFLNSACLRVAAVRYMAFKKDDNVRKKIEIGEREFATKKDALNHFKTILNSYEFGLNLNKDDLKDILDLLESHPNVKEKLE